MLLRAFTAAVLSGTFFIIAPAPQAHAGNAGKVLGGIAAGAAAGFIAHKVYKHQKQKKRARTYHSKRTYRSKPRYRAAFNQDTFNTQTWLNQLGYNAGVADGVSGRRTRAAIRQFQIANGMPSTGVLSAQQTALLSQQASTAVAGAPRIIPGNQYAGVPAQGVVPVTPGIVAPAVGAATGVAAYNAVPSQQVAVVQPQIVQPVQPQLIQPQAVQPVAPQLVQPAQPSIGQPAQSAPLLEVSTPAPSEPVISAAPYSTMADRPSVLGVKVGGSFANVPSSLQNEGFSNCETYANAMFCERPTGFGSDKIAVAASGGKVHTVTRKLSFNQALTPAQIFAPMPAQYKSLINANNHKIASSAACGALVSAAPTTFDKMVEQSTTNATFDAASTGFAHACNYYFAINLADTPTVNEVELTFFDANPILASLNGGTQETAQNKTELKF